MLRAPAIALLALCAVLLACGSDTRKGGGGSAGSGGGGAGGGGGSGVTCAMKIGTGEMTFTALHDGDAVDVIHGPQGGYHIWGAFLARGFDASKQLLLEYDLFFEDGTPYRKNAFCIPPLKNDHTVAGWKQHTGLYGYFPTDAVPAVDLMGGKKLRLQMELRDAVVTDPDTGSCKPDGEPTCTAAASALVLPVVPQP